MLNMDDPGAYALIPAGALVRKARPLTNRKEGPH